MNFSIYLNSRVSVVENNSSLMKTLCILGYQNAPNEDLDLPVLILAGCICPISDISDVSTHLYNI